MGSFQDADLHRRVHHLILAGTVEEVDLSTARARVRVGDLVTDLLPWLTRRAGPDADWWPVEVGEQVVLLCPSGDPACGWILPARYTGVFRAPADRAGIHLVVYADGARVSYDRENHCLKAVLPAGGTALLVAPGGVTIRGDVSLEGNLAVSGDAQVGGEVRAEGDVVAGAISLQTHVHGGVQTGGAQTGGPQ
ncbi:MAG: phage baseplate assembly protein V [Acidobacteriota bacterium]